METGRQIALRLKAARAAWEEAFTRSNRCLPYFSFLDSSFSGVTDYAGRKTTLPLWAWSPPMPRASPDVQDVPILGLRSRIGPAFHVLAARPSCPRAKSSLRLTTFDFENLNPGLHEHIISRSLFKRRHRYSDFRRAIRPPVFDYSPRSCRKTPCLVLACCNGGPGLVDRRPRFGEKSRPDAVRTNRSAKRTRASSTRTRPRRRATGGSLVALVNRRAGVPIGSTSTASMPSTNSASLSHPESSRSGRMASSGSSARKWIARPPTFSSATSSDRTGRRNACSSEEGYPHPPLSLREITTPKTAPLPDGEQIGASNNCSATFTQWSATLAYIKAMGQSARAAPSADCAASGRKKKKKSTSRPQNRVAIGAAQIINIGGSEFWWPCP